MGLFATHSTDAFAAQFNADGDSFLFRAAHRRAPVRVTSAERDAAIFAYEGWSFWLWIIRIVVIIPYIFIAPDDISGKVKLVLILAYVAGTEASTSWAYSAPTRKFLDRKPVGEARSAAEVRVILDRQITWPGLIGLGFGGIILTAFLVGLPRKDETWWLLLIGPIMLAMLPYGIWRKFRSI